MQRYKIRHRTFYDFSAAVRLRCSGGDIPQELYRNDIVGRLPTFLKLLGLHRIVPLFRHCQCLVEAAH